jgi:Short chain fatty acid transporter
MGMMVESGLAKSLSEWFVSFSTSETLPLFTFWSAGLLNILIPSGGDQWAVQSQVMLPAAIELKADLTRVAMAVAWGDAWTNLIQPFWALPALAIAGLKAKDVMGFCLIVLIVSGVVISTGCCGLEDHRDATLSRASPPAALGRLPFPAPLVQVCGAVASGPASAKALMAAQAASIWTILGNRSSGTSKRRAL